jgi:PadR family transcriptional regulator PadR
MPPPLCRETAVRMPKRRTTSSYDQFRGTLEMLVLKSLETGPLHGYAIALRLERLSADVLSLEEGSLYPALYRMERRGWLTSVWAVTDTGRRARFYKLTRSGRAQLAIEAATWQRLTLAVRDVMGE